MDDERPRASEADDRTPSGDEPLMGADRVEMPAVPGPLPIVPTTEDAAAIGRLVDEVLPLLIARFRAGRMGELEVRREGWHVRVRRPADELAPIAGGADAARTTDSGRRGRSAAAGQTAGAGHAPAAPAGSSGAQAGLAAVGPGRPVDGHGAAPAVGPSLVATSPGVGYFATRDGIASGSQVRAGDVLGHVDVLGVRQEVAAPGDGIVARLLAEAGEAVEYGQDLVRLEPVARADPVRDA